MTENPFKHFTFTSLIFFLHTLHVQNLILLIFTIICFLSATGCFGFSLSLSASTIISFFVAMISAIIDSIADYDACAKICYVSSPPKHAMNRGVLVEGIATFIAGMIGIGHGTNSYGGNIGAIGITRVRR